MVTKRMGLIKGRHEIPVTKYIFETEIENVFDFTNIRSHIREVLTAEFPEVIEKRSFWSSNIHYTDYTDVGYSKFRGILILYVTGLTPVLVEVISECCYLGIGLILNHYNKDTGEYIFQYFDR